MIMTWMTIESYKKKNYLAIYDKSIYLDIKITNQIL